MKRSKLSKPIISKDIFNSENKRISIKTKSKMSNTIIYLILITVSVVWILPFIYLLLQSFAKNYSPSVIIPKEWTLDNYRALFDTSFVIRFNNKEIIFAEVYPFGKWFLNTLVIAIIVSIFQTLLTLMTSYAFSRLNFSFRKKYMKLILIIGMFPSFLGIIITFYILKQVNLTTGIPGLFGLMLIYISNAVMNYYVSKGFFDTVSKSLDEAAMLDGANKNTIFWKIIMPLSKPIIVYTLLIAFIAPWGEYMFASVISAGDSRIFNVAVGLQQLLTKESGVSGFPIFCAAGVIVSIPIMTLFFFLQNYYVEGVTGGAVKG